MAKAIQFFQAGFNFPQRLPRCNEIFVPDLAQTHEQVIKRFGVVNERRKRPIAQDELANRLATSDPTLMMFQVSEKRLQLIIGGGHMRDAVTGEQAPPAVAHGFRDVGHDSGMLWLFLRLPR